MLFRSWDAGRFFYVESRVRVILNNIHRDEEINKTKNMIENQALSLDGSLQKSLYELADEKSKSINAEQITYKEQKMVKEQLEEIISILEKTND